MSHVLILMAAYNGARFLPGQLASIAAQSHADWSLWVSDDGSEDDTQARVRRFAQSVSQEVRLVQGPGRGSAQNFLSLLCHPDLPLGPGTHVAFSDQDDLWYPDKLRLALDALQGAAPTAIYGARYDVIDADGTIIADAPPNPAEGLRPGDPFLWTVTGGLTTMLSPGAAGLLRQAGRAEVPYHDWWMGLVVAACGGEIVLRDDRVIGYRQHGTNVLGANMRRGAALRRIAAVLDGTYGGWVQANAKALLAADLPLTPHASEAARLLASRGAGPARLARMRRLGLRRRDRLSTFAAYLAALAGRL